MLVAAVALLSISSIGIISSVIMEIKTREPVYMMMMKIFPWFFGVGAVLLAFAITTG